MCVLPNSGWCVCTLSLCFDWEDVRYTFVKHPPLHSTPTSVPLCACETSSHCVVSCASIVCACHDCTCLLHTSFVTAEASGFEPIERQTQSERLLPLTSLQRISRLVSAQRTACVGCACLGAFVLLHASCIKLHHWCVHEASCMRNGFSRRVALGNLRPLLVCSGRGSEFC